MFIELLTTVLILGLAILRPDWIRRLPRHVSQGFRRWGCRRWLTPALVGISAFGLSLVLSVAVRWPVPAVHDEFCYLLGADTFVHGRLANPPHPLWEHFETFHVLSQPTYQMKYPPGQSLFLAAGQSLGHPLIGVWLSLAAALAAVCWMLQAWVPPRWSILGVMVLGSNVALLAWWGQTYWGGAVAMLGGALVYGAIPRILRNPRPLTCVVLALGLATLANTRPYEGLLACVPGLCLLLGWWFRQDPTRPTGRASAIRSGRSDGLKERAVDAGTSISAANDKATNGVMDQVSTAFTTAVAKLDETTTDPEIGRATRTATARLLDAIKAELTGGGPTEPEPPADPAPPKPVEPGPTS